MNRRGFIKTIVMAIAGAVLGKGAVEAIEDDGCGTIVDGEPIPATMHPGYFGSVAPMRGKPFRFRGVEPRLSEAEFVNVDMNVHTDITNGKMETTTNVVIEQDGQSYTYQVDKAQMNFTTEPRYITWAEPTRWGDDVPVSLYDATCDNDE